MNPIFRLLLNLLLILSCLHFSSCSSTDKSSETPEGVYAIAQEFEKDERYDEAIRRYQEVKNKFPYSNWAAKAELAIADVHYKDEAYAEAQVSYQAFKELHPKHAQIDYVAFRIGMSFYKQLPESNDRDLTLANDAVTAFDDVIKNYPQSEHVAEAKEKREECLKKLAAKEDYIGDFYFKREKFLAAFGRYENLINRYPNLGFDARALSRAAISAHKISREDKSTMYLKKLKAQFPDSPEYFEARKVIE
jgi:outer membrane protein assembly factor BamD